MVIPYFFQEIALKDKLENLERENENLRLHIKIQDYIIKNQTLKEERIGAFHYIYAIIAFYFVFLVNKLDLNPFIVGVVCFVSCLVLYLKYINK